MQRLDIALVERYPEHSRSQLQRAITAGYVSVNGLIAKKPKASVTDVDVIIIAWPEQQELSDTATIPILYEDDAILVFNKQPGVTTHPGNHTTYATASAAAVAHDPSIASAVFDPTDPTSTIRPGIVHRLDRDTSGVLVIAKTREALLNLQQQFQNRTVQKTYVTVLYGSLPEVKDVRAPIVRRGGGSENLLRASHRHDVGRPARTMFIPNQTITSKQGTEIQLVECLLFTGRTHQIRVHAKFIGHPVMGDERYGHKTSLLLSKRMGIERQLLHAHTLSLEHPVTGQAMLFTAPIPPDIDELFPSASIVHVAGQSPIPAFDDEQDSADTSDD
jgi:23S rRNA pseudouridine1911/1915/1917 synthase